MRQFCNKMLLLSFLGTQTVVFCQFLQTSVPTIIQSGTSPSVAVLAPATLKSFVQTSTDPYKITSTAPDSIHSRQPNRNCQYYTSEAFDPFYGELTGNNFNSCS